MLQHRALARAAARLCVRAGSTTANVASTDRKPACGVCVVVLRHDVLHKVPQVLMVRRGKEPDYGRLSLPGGSVDLGETVVQCARREILEETGLHLSMDAPVDSDSGLRSVLAVPQVRLAPPHVWAWHPSAYTH